MAGVQLGWRAVWRRSHLGCWRTARIVDSSLPKLAPSVHGMVRLEGLLECVQQTGIRWHKLCLFPAVEIGSAADCSRRYNFYKNNAPILKKVVGTTAVGCTNAWLRGRK